MKITNTVIYFITILIASVYCDQKNLEYMRLFVKTFLFWFINFIVIGLDIAIILFKKDKKNIIHNYYNGE